MPGKAYAGRVGGIAVALGVVAAIVTGWGSGLAWADESGGTAGSTASSTAPGTEPATANSSEAQGAATSGDTGTTTTTGRARRMARSARRLLESSSARVV